MKRTLFITALVLLLLISATALVSPLQLHWHNAGPSAASQLVADASVASGDSWGGITGKSGGDSWGG